MADWREMIEQAMLRAPRPWDRDYGGYSSHVELWYAVRFIQEMCDRDRERAVNPPG